MWGSRVPPELLAQPRWVTWVAEYRGDHKPAKVLRDVHHPDLRGSSTNPATWGTHEQAARVLSEHPEHTGLGIVLGDGLGGADLDACLRPDGTVLPAAGAILQRLDSYTEVSPSGTGLHVLFRGTLPAGRRQGPIPGGRLELYDGGRYFTFSGEHFPGSPLAVAERTHQVAAVHARYLGGLDQTDADRVPLVAPGPVIADDQLDRRIRAFVAKVGARSVGSRDTTAFYLSAALSHDFALSEAEVWAWLVSWNESCRPPQAARDLRLAFRSGIRNGQRPVGSALAEEPRPMSWRARCAARAQEYAG